MILNEDGSINGRKNWHTECATKYMIIYNSREQLKLLGFNDDEIETIIGGFKSFRDYSLPNQGDAPEKNKLFE